MITGSRREVGRVFIFQLHDIRTSLTPSENRLTQQFWTEKSLCPSRHFKPSLPRQNAVALPLVLPPPLPFNRQNIFTSIVKLRGRNGSDVLWCFLPSSPRLKLPAKCQQSCLETTPPHYGQLRFFGRINTFKWIKNWLNRIQHEHDPVSQGRSSLNCWIQVGLNELK